MRISKYFSDYEVGKSSTATRLGIDNTPPPDVIKRATYLATAVMDPVREQFGPLSPQSWYRCEALERAITWKTGFTSWCRRKNRPVNENSWAMYFARKSHPRGEAADIEFAHVANRKLFDWISANIPVYDQLILEFHKVAVPNSGWVHVSIKEKDNRMQAFEYE